MATYAFAGKTGQWILGGDALFSNTYSGGGYGIQLTQGSFSSKYGSATMLDKKQVEDSWQCDFGVRIERTTKTLYNGVGWAFIVQDKSYFNRVSGKYGYDGLLGRSLGISIDIRDGNIGVFTGGTLSNPVFAPVKGMLNPSPNDNRWHQVRITYSRGGKLLKVYFDDMTTEKISVGFDMQSLGFVGGMAFVGMAASTQGTTAGGFLEVSSLSWLVVQPSVADSRIKEEGTVVAVAGSRGNITVISMDSCGTPFRHGGYGGLWAVRILFSTPVVASPAVDNLNGLYTFTFIAPANVSGTFSVQATNSLSTPTTGVVGIIRLQPA
jgi:hypothetical protein